MSSEEFAHNSHTSRAINVLLDKLESLAHEEERFEQDLGRLGPTDQPWPIELVNDFVSLKEREDMVPFRVSGILDRLRALHWPTEHSDVIHYLDRIQSGYRLSSLELRSIVEFLRVKHPLSSSIPSAANWFEEGLFKTLCEARKKRGHAQKQAAATLGVSPETYRKWEYDRDKHGRPPNPEQMRLVLDYCRVDTGLPT